MNNFINKIHEWIKDKIDYLLFNKDMLLKQNWVIVIIATCIIFMLFIGIGASITGTVFNPDKQKNKKEYNQVTQNSFTYNVSNTPQEELQTTSENEAKKEKKLLEFIASILGFNDNTTNSSQSTNSQSAQNTNSLSRGQNSRSSITNTVVSNNRVSRVGNSGSSGGSTEGSSNPGQTGAGTGLNPPTATPTPVTDIQLIFLDQNGQTQVYVPPSTAPIDVNWLRYTNHQDHYSINIPANWTMVKSEYNGHESVTLYEPGINLSNVNLKSIAFVGWPLDYLSSSSNKSGQVIVSGVFGTYYTNGTIGTSSIATVFNPGDKYFAIGSSSSDPIFAYVFYEMLKSLVFD